jgi:hypothetical protein
MNPAVKTDEEGKPLDEKKDNRTEQELLADANAAVYGKKNPKAGVNHTNNTADEDLGNMKKDANGHNSFPISDVTI